MSIKYTTLDDLLSAPLFAKEQLAKQLGSTLVLAPHPDDESLGCGGLIQYLINQNSPVLVCFVTSGGASHPNSIKFPPSRLAKIREQEAIAACEILGLDASKILFLRESDSKLKTLTSDQNKEISLKLAKVLMENKISTLVLPWRRDPHSDHRASFKLGENAIAMLDQDIQLIEYPIWLWKNSIENDWPILDEVEIFRLEISDILSKKKQAIFAHQSQTSTLIDDDLNGFTFNEDLLSPFLTNYEYFFFPRDNSKNSLAQDYFDTLYSNNEDPWNFKNSTYEERKYQKINTFLENRKYDLGLELGCSIGVHTSFLAAHCKKLLAVDISEDAVATAKVINRKLQNVEFQEMNILHEFPEEKFQFISMCEMGYYFSEDDLLFIFQKIVNALEKKGSFLMVHWTSYVREYPLTGKLVHQLFEEFNSRNDVFSMVSKYTHDRYEIMLWEKKT